MSSVDSRIVSMKFDNESFRRGVSSTMSQLAQLKASLNFDKSVGQLNNLQTASKNLNVGNVGEQAVGVSGKFLAMATVGITALSRITTAAIATGTQMVKSLTIDPIRTGLQEYETNLNAIQTILANTSAAGTGLPEVNKALQELNHYSDQTIYNFSEMARNIGTFTAAGVDLDTATASIKGIANLAALSGSNSEQASTAMYQLSQAISAGRVSLMDWNSVVNAGMGGTVFQRALAQTAEKMGTLDKGAVKLTGKMKNVTIAGESFRESVSAKPGEESWLTSEVLTSTLEQFTGDLSEAELKAQGFSKAQIKAIRDQALMAKNAATQVKTATQLMGTLREAAGSGWAQSWQLILGDFEEAKALFTNVNNVVGGFISGQAEARNKVLGEWKKLGGRTALLDALGQGFKAFMAIVNPIRQAFRDVFPAMTGARLKEITDTFRDFMTRVREGAEGLGGLRETFRGIFSILSIGKSIISGVIGFIGRLFGMFASGSGSIFQVSGSIGDLIYNFSEWLKQGDKIGTIFDKLGDATTTVLQPAVDLFRKFMDLVGGGITTGFQELVVGFNELVPRVQQFGAYAVAAFQEARTSVQPLIDIFDRVKESLAGVFDFGGGGAGGGASSGVAAIQQQLEPVVDMADRIKMAGQEIRESFDAMMDRIRPIGDAIASVFGVIRDKVMDFVSGMGIEEGLALVNTGFFIAFYRMMKGFFGEMKGLVASAKGMFDSVGGVLQQVTDNLKTMQADVRADIILKIAGSLALLAGAIYILSKVDPAGLATGLAAVGVMLAMLVRTLKALEDNTSTRGSINLALLTVGLVGISLALVAMAGAIALLGSMDTDTIIRGLAAVAGILAVVVAAASVLGTTGGAGQMVLAAGAMLILAAALTAIAGVIKLYEAMDVAKMAEGVAKIAGVLIALGISMQFFPPNMVATAAGLFIVAAALTVLAGVMKIYGSMSLEEMAKSIGMLSYSLGVIAIAVNLMTGSLGGAAALVVVAGALAIIAPVLAMLGMLPLKVIGIGLLAISGVFLVLGVAGYALAPVAPIIMLLAKAVALLGVAAIAAGLGTLAFAAGLGALVALGAAGAAALGAMIIVVAESIPLVMQQFGLGIIAFAKVIEESGPPLARAMTVALLALLQAIRNVAPAFGDTLIVLLDVGLKVLMDALPKLQRAGYQLIISLLQGLADNIPRLTRAAANVIIQFMRSMAHESWRIADQGFKTVIKFLDGLTRAVRENSDELNRAGADLAWAMIDGATQGLRDGASHVATEAWNMAIGAWNSAMDALNANSPSKKFISLGRWSDEGMAIGLKSYAHVANDAASGMAVGVLDTVSDAMSHIGDAISGDVDMSPVIAPVIDLDQFRRDASTMSGYLPDSAVVGSVSRNQAAGLSREASAAAAAAAAEAPTTVFNFEQKNYSPESLTTTEIYRRTNNQLSQARTALGIPA